MDSIVPNCGKGVKDYSQQMQVTHQPKNGLSTILIAEDEAEQTHNEHTKDLEKLLRFKRDLLELLNNFVSFSAFYQRKGAIFQAGTLYLDARSCDLTVQVTDAAQHAKLAGLAKTAEPTC